MDKARSWNATWMDIALTIAKRSKDPDTKVGCVLVSPDNRRIFIGYNGFARGVIENIKRWERPEKYERVIHAEQNALNQRNCDVDGWTAYCTLSPCHKCAIQLSQCGIKRVVYYTLRDNELTNECFEETGVEMVNFIDNEGAEYENSSEC